MIVLCILHIFHFTHPIKADLFYQMLNIKCLNKNLYRFYSECIPQPINFCIENLMYQYTSNLPITFLNALLFNTDCLIHFLC